MWNYEKRLQYPINIKNCNPTLAAMIISQYGGPDSLCVQITSFRPFPERLPAPAELLL